MPYPRGADIIDCEPYLVLAHQLWDLRQTASPVSTFEGHSSAVFSLQMDATKMISGSADTTIKIFRFL